MAYEMEPLDASLWFQRIEMIAGRVLPIENALRHASHLLQLAPPALRPVVRLATDEHYFETLLAAGDFDTAARHLVAQPTSLALEPGRGEDQVIAAISCVVLKRVITGTGETAAAAILDAWSACLLAIKSTYGEHLAEYIEANMREGERTNTRH